MIDDEIDDEIVECYKEFDDEWMDELPESYRDDPGITPEEFAWRCDMLCASLGLDDTKLIYDDSDTKFEALRRRIRRIIADYKNVLSKGTIPFHKTNKTGLSSQ